MADRISSMRCGGMPRHHSDFFGKRWWTAKRDETLLYIMRTYDDLAKASRVLGCPAHFIERRLKFLAVHTQR